MVAGILNTYGNDIDTLTILPSGGGAYNIWKNDTLVFIHTGGAAGLFGYQTVFGGK